MPIKTPKFWYRDKSLSSPIIEKILSPISILYQVGHNINLATRKANKLKIPVICVGNITMGGSGKTPTIIAIYKLITENNMASFPYFLSRGYGGNATNARCIDVHDDAKDTGDEPLILASHSKTIISMNRVHGAHLARDLGSDCVLMDDGFQNPTLIKDLSIIVIDGKTGFGNNKLFPAGPLREPVNKAFTRAQAVIIIGKDITGVRQRIPPHIPIFNAFITPTNLKNVDLTKKYIGFAGLGYPMKFYDTLIQNNINVAKFYDFADHHPYSEKDIDKLIAGANNIGARLITTQKDYMRIPQNYHDQIDYLSIELLWHNKDEIIDFLNNAFLSFNNTK